MVLNFATFSARQFTLETADSKTKQKYTADVDCQYEQDGQRPQSASNKGDDYTKGHVHPRFSRSSKCNGIDNDLEALMKRRVYDLAGTSKGVKVWLNSARESKINSFKKYMEMYTKAIKKERGDEAVERCVRDYH